MVTKQAIHSANLGTVLLASLSAPLGRPKDRQRRPCSLQAGKELLARLLAGHFLTGRHLDLTVTQDRLGQPQLLMDGGPGPAISFSWGGGRLWAGMGATGKHLGVDVTTPGEFAGAYPRQRVFAQPEWRTAAALTGGDPEEAAALLWSVKEAGVKAQGCGFHFFGPRQVRAELTGRNKSSLLWRGYLDVLSPDRAFLGGQEIFAAASLRLKEIWLSVAWMPAASANGEVPDA